MEQNIKFILAKKEDIDLIYSFIMQIAKYEKMEDQVTLDKKDLENELFNKNAATVEFIKSDDKVIGYIVYFFNFSTFKGHRGLYLEDLYIQPEYRHNGIGKLSFKHLCKIAQDNKCQRMEWVCLKWNKPSIDFYHSLGAVEMDEWMTFRLTEDKIKNNI